MYVYIYICTSVEVLRVGSVCLLGLIVLLLETALLLALGLRSLIALPLSPLALLPHSTLLLPHVTHFYQHSLNQSPDLFVCPVTLPIIVILV